MPGILESITSNIGRAVGSFQKARREAAGISARPRFLTSWADSSKWAGGDLGASDAAQQRAMQSSWLYTAVGMIAREVSAATLEVYKHSGLNEEPEQVLDHPLLQIMRRPNPIMGRAFMWQYTSTWLSLDGNAFWFLAPDDDGALAEIWPLPSNCVEPWPGDMNKGEKFIDHYEFTIGGQTFEIPSHYICHFQYPNPYDVYRGLSPLTAGMLPVDADVAMARWNAAFFGSNNVMPSAIINLSNTPELPIDAADIERIKDQLRSDFSATERKTLITNAQGITVNQLGWSAKDMDFLAGRNFEKDEIFAIYGIPGGLLDKNATEANAQTADRVFKEKTIWPVLTLMAEQITAQVMGAWYGDEYESAFEDIRPTNRQQELSEAGVAMNVLSIDEVREKYFKMPALPDGRGARLPSEPPPQAEGSLPGGISPDMLAGMLGNNPGGAPPGGSTPGGSEPGKPTQPAPTAPNAAPAPEKMAEGTGAGGGYAVAPDDLLRRRFRTGVKAKYHDGAMLALFVPLPRANALALQPELLPPGGEICEPAELHVTLCYLGNTNEVAARPDEIIARLRDFVRGEIAPISGKIGGVGRFFHDEGDGLQAFHLIMDIPGLAELRQALIACLDEIGVTARQSFDFKPHITLGYLPADQPTPHVDYTGMQITFPFITLAWAGERTAIPLDGGKFIEAAKALFDEQDHPRSAGGQFAPKGDSESEEQPGERSKTVEEAAPDFYEDGFEDEFSQERWALEDKIYADRMKRDYQRELRNAQREAEKQIESAAASRDALGLARAIRKYNSERSILQDTYRGQLRKIGAPQRKFWQIEEEQSQAMARVAVKAELRAWQEKAKSALKAGKPASVAFSSEVLPAGACLMVEAALKAAGSLDEVKAVFERAESAALGMLVQDVDYPDDTLARAVDELAKANELLESVKAGAKPGHEFYGNQWTEDGETEKEKQVEPGGHARGGVITVGLNQKEYVGGQFLPYSDEQWSEKQSAYVDKTRKDFMQRKQMVDPYKWDFPPDEESFSILSHPGINGIIPLDKSTGKLELDKTPEAARGMYHKGQEELIGKLVNAYNSGDRWYRDLDRASRRDKIAADKAIRNKKSGEEDNIKLAPPLPPMTDDERQAAGVAANLPGDVYEAALENTAPVEKVNVETPQAGGEPPQAGEVSESKDG